MLEPMERDERRIWSVSAYPSVFGHVFDSRNIACCSENALRYASRSRHESTFTVRYPTYRKTAHRSTARMARCARGCMVAARPLQSAEALLQAPGCRSRAFARGCRLRGPTARLLGFETLVLWREALKVGDVTRKLRFCRSPFFPEAVVGICREEAFIKRHVEMVQNFAE